MAEQSIFWATGSGEPGDNSEITQAMWQRLLRALYNLDNGDHCVIPFIDEQLNAVSNANHILDIQEGMAISNGGFYWNDSSLRFDAQSSTPATRRIPTLAQATRHRIVSRWNLSEATVRTVIKTNASGVSVDPPLTRNANVWEYPLWGVGVSPSGSITLDDQRDYIAAHVPRDGTLTAAMAAVGGLVRNLDGANGIFMERSMTATAFQALGARNANTRYFVRAG